jgi:predicted ATPase/DNA-binding winged helix-turn-helix (wHTH) protein
MPIMSTPITPAVHRSACRFGRFELHPEDRRLLADGASIALGRRAFDLLLVLVREAGILVSKDRLLAEAWPGLVVEENNLQVQVSALRKVLGPDAIETVPGHGYRFTQTVEPIEHGASFTNQMTRHTLPSPLTSFVGHEDDLVEYAEALRQFRLLTLTGIGGAGKTRLAIRLAESMASTYPDGVWFIDLAALQETDLLAAFVARATGAPEAETEPPLEFLGSRFARSQSLLVLDNCEHLLEACATLTRHLLEHASNLHVIATSREGLGVRGEHIVAVRSLTVPSNGEEAATHLQQTSEAVRLFVERAQLVDRTFVLDQANCRAIADICRRLDGIPLAIELAAARINVLSADQIRERLNDRFRLLVNRGSATPRHQTLQAVLQWSYDHLTSKEQRLVRFCSVFVGGWALEAVSAVCKSDICEPELVDLLEGLVAKSLVGVDRRSTSGPRFRMLETVRQFVYERLASDPQVEDTHTRHLYHFLAMAERVDDAYVGQTNDYFYPRLDTDRENFGAAHAWCRHSASNGEVGLRLASALLNYWVERKYLLSLPAPETDPVEEGYRVMVAALSNAGAQARTRLRCRALFGASHLAFLLQRFDTADEYLDESLSISRELSETSHLSARLRVRGYFQRLRGELPAARRSVEEALAVAEASGSKHEIALNCRALGEVLLAEDALGLAADCFNRALELGRELCREPIVGSCLLDLCIVAMMRNDRVATQHRLCEALPIVEKLKEWQYGIQMLQACSGFAAHLGEASHAARFYGATKGRLANLIPVEDPCMARFLAPRLASSETALGKERFGLEVTLGRSMSYQDALENVGSWLKGLTPT